MNTEIDDLRTFADYFASTVAPEFRKALVVDDDPAMLRIVSKVLETAGYEVVRATNGLEAIEALRHDLPCFVITDWEMPVLDGAEFCRMIRQEKLPHYVYIVMLTGSYADRLVEGLASGADDFVTKPVKAQELLARMQAGARVLKLEDRLRLLASRDPLTELPNRRTFFELFEHEWRRSRRAGYPLSCAMIDVDFFKKVNDNYGHLVGDAVLKWVSRMLLGVCRESDCICRYGGEEFAVVLPDTNEQGALMWGERCRLAVARAAFVSDGTTVPITVSVGVAQREDSLDTAEKLLDLADRALLAAKRQGRNQVVALGSLERSEIQV